MPLFDNIIKMKEIVPSIVLFRNMLRANYNSTLLDDNANLKVYVLIQSFLQLEKRASIVHIQPFHLFILKQSIIQLVDISLTPGVSVAFVLKFGTPHANVQTKNNINNLPADCAIQIGRRKRIFRANPSKLSTTLSVSLIFFLERAGGKNFKTLSDITGKCGSLMKSFHFVFRFRW